MFSHLQFGGEYFLISEKACDATSRETGGYSGMSLAPSHFAMNNKFSKIMGIASAVVLFFLFSLHAGAAGAYEGATVTDGGAIRGKVRLQGEIPPMPPLEVYKFKEVCKDVPDESLVVGLNFGVRYAVISLEGISRGEEPEREVVNELDNRDCRFVPHVQAASVGQWLNLRNSDPILHAAHAVFEAGQPDFNVGLYPGSVRRKPLASAGLVRIRCEVHPWMIAYIVVTEHPYHAVSDLFGEYELRNVPPGTYRLKVWHERLGVQVKDVVVRSKGISTVDFLLRMEQGGVK